MEYTIQMMTQETLERLLNVKLKDKIEEMDDNISADEAISTLKKGVNTICELVALLEGGQYKEEQVTRILMNSLQACSVMGSVCGCVVNEFMEIKKPE